MGFIKDVIGKCVLKTFTTSLLSSKIPFLHFGFNNVANTSGKWYQGGRIYGR